MELTPERATSAEQERYARVLEWGARIGFFLLVAAFLGYVLGWVAPQVPLERLPELWGHPAAVYLRESGLQAGWGSIAFAHRGDVMTLAGIAVLATCSVPCLAAVAPLFWARREWAHVAICVLQVIVLLVSASGVLAGGH